MYKSRCKEAVLSTIETTSVKKMYIKKRTDLNNKHCAHNSLCDNTRGSTPQILGGGGGPGHRSGFLSLKQSSFIFKMSVRSYE